MTSPSLLKRVYCLIKYFLTLLKSNKCPTEPIDDPCVNKASVDNINLPIKSSRNIFEQVFITDCVETYQWASKNTFMFSLFKFLQKFKCLRFVLDDATTVNPCWQSVLYLVEVVDMSEPIEITDTLILHCETTEKYDRLIPRIRGAYNRLILHGHTTWNQIKQLWHPGVKQIRINATFEISPSEHDEFINFIKKQCRGMEYTFTIAYEANCPMDLLQKLYKVFRSYKAYEMELSKRFYDVFYGPRIPIHIVFNIFFLFLLVGIVYLVLSFSTNIDKIDNDTKGSLWSVIVITIGVIVVGRSLFVPLADVKIDVKDKNFANTIKQIMGN